MLVDKGAGFGRIPLASRTEKPRVKGITMMVEWGLPLGAQQDLLELAAPVIDIAKVAVGISGLLEERVLARKIALYREHEVEPFPGGMYLEYAFAKGEVEAYFDGCEKAGYRYVEVSDNAVPLEREDKDALIGRARSRGFTVLGEAGSKRVTTDAAALVEDVQACMDAGCWRVFLEAAELFEGGKFRHEVFEQVAHEVRAEDVMWELPGAWIPNVHAHEIHALEVLLLERVGADVNIANVPSDGLLSLEALRRGVGVRALMDGGE
jgi:phosphosulfolactate synthase